MYFEATGRRGARDARRMLKRFTAGPTGPLGADTAVHSHAWFWKPKTGFYQHRGPGIAKALILYVLVSHPYLLTPRTVITHGPELTNGRIFNGHEFLYEDRFSCTILIAICGIDFPVASRSDYMKGKLSITFENSPAARFTHNRRMRCVSPKKLVGYDRIAGDSASDGARTCRSERSKADISLYDYVPASIPYGPDDGTLAPWPSPAPCLCAWVGAAFSQTHHQDTPR